MLGGCMLTNLKPEHVAEKYCKVKAELSHYSILRISISNLSVELG